MNLTPEQLIKAKNAESAEALISLADECGVALTEDEAKFYFDKWRSEGELADKELADVSGGSQCVDGRSYSSDPPYYLITTWGNTCPGYTFVNSVAPRNVDNGTCYMCAHASKPRVPMYCYSRKADDDPYK